MMNVCGLFSYISYLKSSKMKIVVLTASILLFVLSGTNSVRTQEAANSCDGISDDMRSQICLSGQCPLDCGYVNSSQYSQCDQVCVLKPCTSLSCKTSICVQRCLSGGCNTMMCSSTDCTQTCLGNCTAVNCTATSKCNQQCEKGNCDLLAIGGGVTEQTCEENCGLKCSEGATECTQQCGRNCTSIRCQAKQCVQTCTQGSCNMYCDKLAEMCVMSCPGGNCKLHCDGRKCKRDCFGASGCEMSGSGKEVVSSKGNAPGVVSVALCLPLAAMSYFLLTCEF